MVEYPYRQNTNQNYVPDATFSKTIAPRCSHQRAAAVLLLRLRVEHATLTAQVVTLFHQGVDLFASLEDGLDCSIQELATSPVNKGGV